MEAVGKASGNDAGYGGTLGAVLYRAGRPAEAVPRLNAAAKQQGEGAAEVWLFLALAHSTLAQRDEARKWLERAKVWFKQNETAGTWTERLERRLLLGEAEALLQRP
jgi:hypothetical protein